jgi:hypothetical protein
MDNLFIIWKIDLLELDIDLTPWERKKQDGQEKNSKTTNLK